MTKQDYLEPIYSEYPFLKRAVFIFGAGRSGTTLLHSLLDNHPQIVVWPFEFLYFSEFERFRKQRGIPKNQEISITDLNEHFLSREDMQAFGQKLFYSLDVYMDLSKVNKEIFFDFMYSFPENLKVSRKAYLMLIMVAYYKAFCPETKPESFIVELHGIRDEVLEDFPDAKFLWAYREPLDNYIAIKKDYFTSYDNKFMTYFPRICIPMYRNGLLEAALWPVLFTKQWVDRNENNIDLFKVDLKQMQYRTKTVLEQLSHFLGVEFTKTMDYTSFAGKIFDSNLSSRQKSKGKVLKTKLYQPEDHLTSFEYFFICKKLNRVPGRIIGVVSLILSFFRLLKYEVPQKVMTTSKDVPLIFRPFMTVFFFILTYIHNRLFFLTYSLREEDPWE